MNAFFQPIRLFAAHSDGRFRLSFALLLVITAVAAVDIKLITVLSQLTTTWAILTAFVLLTFTTQCHLLFDARVEDTAGRWQRRIAFIYWAFVVVWSILAATLQFPFITSFSMFVGGLFHLNFAVSIPALFDKAIRCDTDPTQYWSLIWGIGNCIVAFLFSLACLI